MHRGFSTGGAPAVFIVNRRAGRFRKHPGLVADIAHAVGARGKVFATASLEDLDEAARFAVTSGASAVVICGGDGTYLATVTALTRASSGAPMPPIVLARGGTVSIVARNWGGSADPVSVARRVVERPLTLRFTERPTLAVVESGGERRVGFTFGTGLVANFFDEYERAGAGGNLAALGITLHVFAESLVGGPFASRILSPLPCRITVDGVALAPQAYSLVLCSVLRDVGLHLLVTHRAGEDPARPHLVASPLRPGALGPQFPRVLLGRPLRGPGNFDGLVDSFDVEFADAKGPYVLDGDSFHAERVMVCAGPVIHVAT